MDSEQKQRKALAYVQTGPPDALTPPMRPSGIRYAATWCNEHQQCTFVCVGQQYNCVAAQLCVIRENTRNAYRSAPIGNGTTTSWCTEHYQYSWVCAQERQNCAAAAQHATGPNTAALPCSWEEWLAMTRLPITQATQEAYEQYV